MKWLHLIALVLAACVLVGQARVVQKDDSDPVNNPVDPSDNGGDDGGDDDSDDDDDDDDQVSFELCVKSCKSISKGILDLLEGGKRLSDDRLAKTGVTRDQMNEIKKVKKALAEQLGGAEYSDEAIEIAKKVIPDICKVSCQAKKDLGM